MTTFTETTHLLRKAYPLMNARGTDCPYVYVGELIRGGSGSYAFDWWWLYNHGVTKATNSMLFGDVGGAKSSLVTCLILRSLHFGRRASVVDVKGEYGPLAEAAEAAGISVQRIVLDPAGGTKINPLDKGLPLVDQLALLNALAQVATKRPLDPNETAMVGAAHQAAIAKADRETRPAFLRDVVDLLLRPNQDMVAELAPAGGADQLAAEGRQVATALLSLVNTLAGMLDGATSGGINLDAQLLVFDISRMAAGAYSGDALTAAMACVVTFIQGELSRRGDSGNMVVVFEEGWRFLADIALVQWLAGLFKLIRNYGAASLVVFHRVSDLIASGDQGSRLQAQVEGLLKDCDIRIIYPQRLDTDKEPGDVDRGANLLGLTATERAVVNTLGKGEGLYCVGPHRDVVKHVVSSLEWPIVSRSDDALRRGIA